jgi:uncharacterized protein
MTPNNRTNRLAKEKSPYLLQHQYNPVDWFAWSDEAFEKAQSENKPVFLSIGYSTCHWCHVMEHESFEDPEVAEQLNSHFIAIKVDREERPDIDHIYMNVCQAMTGQGGWPLTVLLTPDKKPFYAGTYFPKRSKWGRPGMMDILTQIAEKWANDRERITQTADQITQAIRGQRTKDEGGSEVDQANSLSMDLLHQAFTLYQQTFDQVYGGFGQAPKFPTPHNLSFLMRYYKETGEQKALEIVQKTLDSMYQGGLYDHLGYGFARYSTDREWLVPHFEKMLYDNALLTMDYLEAYQLTGIERYKRVAMETLTYIKRDMTSPEGGFYSAEDADSEGVEGKFYVWTQEQVYNVVGKEDGTLFCRNYDVSEKGNFEGHNIPNLIGNELDAQLDQQLEPIRQALFAAREERIHPHKDDKILTAWNGLMIAAFSKAAAALQNEEYLQIARQAAEFIFSHLVRKEDGRLLARYREGEAAFPAYVDDYAFLVWGLIELYQASFDPKYLQQALHFHDEMIKLFEDDEQGGLFFYGSDSEQLITRPKEIYDGAIPSGNSTAAYNALRLSHLTGRTDLEEQAEHILHTFIDDVSHYPPGYAQYLTAAQFALGKSREIVLIGNNEDSQLKEMCQAVQTQFLPHTVFLVKSDDRDQITELAPYLKDYKAVDGQATAYICQNFSCQAPTKNVSKLQNL